ncbi:hypothetical protein DAI22_04g174601 [Oryza sativa Japonica Group]|nr:hypothetical protein DAI22_04g174601 [Oryza sativa Japonica Group]
MPQEARSSRPPHHHRLLTPQRHHQRGSTTNASARRGAGRLQHRPTPRRRRIRGLHHRRRHPRRHRPHPCSALLTPTVAIPAAIAIPVASRRPARFDRSGTDLVVIAVAALGGSPVRLSARSKKPRCRKERGRPGRRLASGLWGRATR